MINDIDTRLDSGSTVINIDNKSNGNGTHWTCVYVDPRGKFTYYFDPIGSDLGGYPPRGIHRSAVGSLFANTTTYQPPDSYLCGYYSAAISYLLDHKKPISADDAQHVIESFLGKRSDEGDVERVIRMCKSLGL
jgi:hypothetical protein